MRRLTCPHCETGLSFAPTRRESLRRCREFLWFAAVLAFGAVALLLAKVPLWPWWVGGMAVFVLSQAALKWQNSRWTFCKGCQRGRYVYGPARSADGD